MGSSSEEAWVSPFGGKPRFLKKGELGILLGTNVSLRWATNFALCVRAAQRRVRC